ncbi:hypothetical protein EPN44_03210 [bacterium]|nr:MAG: hypothetical protein EPN44_03210 [bacterium]
MSDTSPIPQFSERFQAFVDMHGKPTVTVLAGAGVATTGAIVPAFHVGMFGVGGSYAIVQAGFAGLFALALPIALGALPIALKPDARLMRLAFGVACALLGIFFAVWMAPLGALFGSLSAGFYLSIVGYAAAAIGYYLLLEQKGAQRVL